jgi:hypothetical protein
VAAANPGNVGYFLESIMSNLAANLIATLRTHRDRPAVKLDDCVLTYAQLHAMARVAATAPGSAAVLG